MDYSALSSENLILVCTESADAAAWQEFIHRFHRLIATIVLRTARRLGEASPQLVDDLIQETYLKLCESNFHILRSFHFKKEGALYAYIKVVTANLVHDYFKAIRSQKRGGGVESTSPDSLEGTPEHTAGRSSVDSTEHNVFIREVDACLRSLESQGNADRDRRIFWLYYRVGLPASDIAALPTIGLSTKGVESTLFRLTRYVRDRMTAKAVPGQASNAKDSKGIQQAESL
jgi:RNA polymerase sigma-70 factor (ECF subfamily)